MVSSQKILLTLMLFPIFQVLNSLGTYWLLRHFTHLSAETAKTLALAVFFLVPVYALILVRSYDTLWTTFKKFKYMAMKVFKRDLVDEFEKQMRRLAVGIREAVERHGKSVFVEFEGMRILKREDLGEISSPRRKL